LALTALFLLALLLLAGCIQTTSTRSTDAQAAVPEEPETPEVADTAIPEPQEDPAPDKLFEWNGTGRSISHVVIDTNEQRARFYEGQEQVGWTTIASGVSKHPTPRGEFEVIEKVAKKRSNLYGRIYDANGNLHKRGAHSDKDKVPAGGKFVGASMPHFMRMTYDGIGMHAGPIPRPGHPASHGCIRLPKEVASNLFAHVDLGTRVTVLGNGPDYGNYAQRVREQREQERISRLAAAEAERNATSSLASPASNNRPSPSARSSSTRAYPSASRTPTPPTPTATSASPVTQVVEQSSARDDSSTVPSTTAGSDSGPSGISSSRSSTVTARSTSGTQASGPARITEGSLAVPVTPQNQTSGAESAPANQGVERSSTATPPASVVTPEDTPAPPAATGGEPVRSSNEAAPSTVEPSVPASQQRTPEPARTPTPQIRSADREQDPDADRG
jgi:lipoprotein-anchoring transpeptidase ErfK/SrfK